MGHSGHVIGSGMGQARKSRTNDMDRWEEWGEVRSVGIGMGCPGGETKVWILA